LAMNEADAQNVDLKRTISKVQQECQDLNKGAILARENNSVLRKIETEAKTQISALKNEKTRALNKNQALDAALRKKETEAKTQISALKNEKIQAQTKNQVLGTENAALRKKESEAQTQKKLLQDSLQTSQAANEISRLHKENDSREIERLKKEILFLQSSVKPQATENGSTATGV
jgi:hypothetical protein